MIRLATVYKQAFDVVYIRPRSWKAIKFPVKLIRGNCMFTKITCGVCVGTGRVEIPDGVLGVIYDPKVNPVSYRVIQCVDCKGTGKRDVTMY